MSVLILKGTFMTLHRVYMRIYYIKLLYHWKTAYFYFEKQLETLFCGTTGLLCFNEPTLHLLRSRYSKLIYNFQCPALDTLDKSLILAGQGFHSFWKRIKRVSKLSKLDMQNLRAPQLRVTSDNFVLCWRIKSLFFGAAYHLHTAWHYKVKLTSFWIIYHPH